MTRDEEEFIDSHRVPIIDAADAFDQRELIKALLEHDEAWLLIADAGRFDVLDELYDGEVFRAYNGGHTTTTSWFTEMFPQEYDLAFFNAGLPMRRMEPGYDEYAHFEYVEARSDYARVFARDRAGPSSLNTIVRAYLEDDVAKRLHDLGYADGERPRSGVVRYMDPHRPYAAEGFELPELSQEGGDAPERTRSLIQQGNLDPAAVRDAYRKAYRIVLRGAQDLAEELPGPVALTADHGEMLGENQLWYHGPDYPDRDELTIVPWVVLKDA